MGLETASVYGPVGFGAAGLGNMFRVLTDDEAWTVLEAAWDGGVRYFDTAPHYGLGLSERRLGAFLQTKPRDEFVISTKAGRLLRTNPDDDGGLDLDNGFHVRTDLRREPAYDARGVRQSLEDSLDRLGLDRIDTLYLHDPERSGHLDQAIDEAYPEMAVMRAEGLIDAIGIGSMVAEAIERSVVESEQSLDRIMIAGRFTLLDQSAAPALDACAVRGTEVVAASVFNSGLLANATPTRDARYEYGDVPDEMFERARRLAAVCDDHGVALPVAAFQYPFQSAQTVSIVMGTTRPEQVRQNLEYATADVPPELWADLVARGLTPQL